MGGASRTLQKVVYGPVPSWRLGSSLGIDLVSRLETCSFDCRYCQLGATQHAVTRRREFVPTARVLAELDALPPVTADYVTFSGMGEPTLAENLGEVIAAVRARFTCPVAVLTNSSLLADAQVRAELALADLVVAKLDAPDEPLFQAFNRPAPGVRFDRVLEGLRRLRTQHPGRVAIQIMFGYPNQGRAADLAALVATLHPDEVQLGTPLRPSAIPPLSHREMKAVQEAFDGLPAVMVYDAPPVATQALDPAQTATRRPSPAPPG